MISNLYSVYDKKAEAYMPVFIMQSDGVAIRSFSDEINKQGSGLNQHPEDYQLYCLGYFDDKTGGFLTVSPDDSNNYKFPRLLVDGLSVVIKHE